MNEVEAELNGRLDWMNDHETRQWRAMTAPGRRRQFVASHWLARRTAVGLRGGDARAWSLEVGGDGRRWLLASGREALAVSISHSGDWIGCAVSEAAIGFDLQAGDRARDFVALAEAVFGANELGVIRTLQGEAQAMAFYQRWSLKEAWAKFDGRGLQRATMRSVEPRECEVQDAEACTWRVAGVHAAVRFVPAGRPDVEQPPPRESVQWWHFVEAGGSG